jgi:predicted nucleic acid-binding protein
MRVLFDTNVVLDLLMKRRPHVDNVAALFVAVDRRQLQGLLCAATVTTVQYLVSKELGVPATNIHLRTLLAMFEIAPVNRDVLVEALALNFPDFEDAVLHEAARHSEATGIVTRNPDDFKQGTLRIYAPDELVVMLRSLQR